MTPASTLPGLLSLRYRDATIGRALHTAAFMLVVAAGFRWLAPTGEPPPGVDLSFETEMAKWVPVGALVIATLAVLVLARRYFWVKKVLTAGTPIKGMVEDLEVYEREASHSENSPAFQRPKIRTYYANIRYAWEGKERKVTLKLPNSPSVYGTFKGKDVDLLVHDSAPNQPLIRSVYLGRV